MAGLIRRTFRVPTIITGIGVTLALGVVGWIVYSMVVVHPAARFLTVAVIGPSHIVISWNRQDQTFLVISMPTTLGIDATHGYGMYTVDGLWKLDIMEKRSGHLYTESVSDALGLPIDGWIDDSMRGGAAPTGTSITSQVLAFPSIRTIVSLVLTHRTSVPLTDFVQFMYALRNAKSDDIYTIDVSDDQYLLETVRPDQSILQTLNIGRISDALAGHSEDVVIRDERLRVAIFNTTPIPGIGQKISRIFTSIGMFVVSVDNSSEKVTTCVVRGTKEKLMTQTSRMMLQLYHCRPQELSEQGNADLTFVAGESVADRYRPYK